MLSGNEISAQGEQVGVPARGAVANAITGNTGRRTGEMVDQFAGAAHKQVHVDLLGGKRINAPVSAPG